MSKLLNQFKILGWEKVDQAFEARVLRAVEHKPGVVIGYKEVFRGTEHDCATYVREAA